MHKNHYIVNDLKKGQKSERILITKQPNGLRNNCSVCLGQKNIVLEKLRNFAII